MNINLLSFPARCLCTAILLYACLLTHAAPARAETWAEMSETLAPGLDLRHRPYNTELGNAEELILLRLDLKR